MMPREFKAVVLDMDGVITQTAKVHARAWKQIFDQYLASRSQQHDESHEPFDIDSDYRKYVDGKPRYEGVRSFLESRGIWLPEGNDDDGPDQETIRGLGNRKNHVFRQRLQQDGVEVYQDTVQQISNWKQAGWKVAVISSSRNCEAVLKAADVLSLFDAKVDGNDLQRLHIRGKPAPDMFLAAAKQVGAEAGQVIIVEDAIAGIQAGRAGQFGLIVGVARNGHDRQLREAGAHWVVHDLRDLQAIPRSSPRRDAASMPAHALQDLKRLAGQVRGLRLGLFLDYDGTLTPIVRRPEEATLSDEVRSLLRDLADHCDLAIVSGRDRQDVQQMVGVENLIYAGSHGFDIAGPGGLKREQQDAAQALPELDQAEQQLRERLAAVSGIRVERKRFAIAVHYREVSSEDDVVRVEQAVDTVRTEHPALRKRDGKKIFELQPDVTWDKGHAVIWLAKSLGLDPDGAFLIYVGDDVTDEDAFEALRTRERAIGVHVAPSDSETKATHYLRDCDEVQQFLEGWLMLLRGFSDHPTQG